MLKTSAEILIHRLEETDCFATHAERISLGDVKKMDVSVSPLIYSNTLIDAKREISHGIKPIKEIAIDFRSKDQYYFSRFFNKFRTLQTIRIVSSG